MSKELECLDRIDKRNYLTEREHKEFLGVVEKALTEYEAIKNAEPSEALDCLETIWCDISTNYINEYVAIKQALLKAQEPKHYLKWEDLEFNRKEAEYMKVSLNGKKYCLVLTWGFCEPKLVKVKPINLYEGKETEGLTIFLLDGNYIDDVQFFNDLHLERVEE